jgi:hypothetical protein
VTSPQIHPTFGKDDQYSLALIAFRDFDRVWYRVDETGFNKVGYITRKDTVVHPQWNRGLRHTPLSQVKRYPHVLSIRVARTREEVDNVEAFFTENVPSIELFNSALHTIITSGDLSFFEDPIRIPILEHICILEFEKRWEVFRSILRPADIIAIIDTKSVVSRLIARFDHGTWSHVGVYSGNGGIMEAITAGVVERDIQVYHQPWYRLGVYRYKSLDEERVVSVLAAMRSQLGKRYNFRGAIRLAIYKLLGIQPPKDSALLSPSDVTPNDLARSERLRLVCVV